MDNQEIVALNDKECREFSQNFLDLRQEISRSNDEDENNEVSQEYSTNENEENRGTPKQENGPADIDTEEIAHR